MISSQAVNLGFGTSSTINIVWERMAVAFLPVHIGGIASVEGSNRLMESLRVQKQIGYKILK